MENRNGKFEQVWSGIGWGLLLILIGMLFIAGNQGWMKEESGWAYFFIGLGGILVIGFLVRYFGMHNKNWNGFGGLIIGLALVFVGIASLYGYGDWWPLALIVIGAGFLARSFWGKRNGTDHLQTRDTTDPTR
jgi:peptidoglycan/LPS O-acetylase OafA/YrhL